LLLHLEAVGINKTSQLKGKTTMSIRLKRILLVDDSPRDTELALDYLYRRGSFPDRATAGQRAFVAAQDSVISKRGLQ
jgi:pantothenate kinase-related protein Tda10